MKQAILTTKLQKFDAAFDPDREDSIRRRLKLFYELFPIERIKHMNIEQYVYGRYFIDHIKTFCYWMEKELDDFGRISGSQCVQYGVWFGTRGEQKERKYRNTNRYGTSVDNALANILTEIKSLHKAGDTHDFDVIAHSMIGNKFKGKVLATYFPDTYISIYAADYLDDILQYFNIDNEQSKLMAPIYKQQLIIRMKNEHRLSKSWSLIKYAMFINEEMAKYFYLEKKEKASDKKAPRFPDIGSVDPEEISLDIDSDFTPPEREANPHSSKKPDYVGKTVRQMAIGDRGEKIIYEMECRKVASFPNCEGKEVEWVSRKTDGQGFDILSFDEGGNPIQIEVKATTGSPGRIEFYLSEFEYLMAKYWENYWVYIVFNIGSKRPKLWKIKQPFHPHQSGITLQPCSYRVAMRTKDH